MPGNIQVFVDTSAPNLCRMHLCMYANFLEPIFKLFRLQEWLKAVKLRLLVISTARLEAE